MSKSKDKLSPEQAVAQIRKAVAAGRVGFQCCFCREVVIDDVTAVVLITHWNGPRENQREQQWFCHAECFTKTTGEPVNALKEKTNA